MPEQDISRARRPAGTVHTPRHAAAGQALVDRGSLFELLCVRACVAQCSMRGSISFGFRGVPAEDGRQGRGRAVLV